MDIGTRVYAYPGWWTNGYWGTVTEVLQEGVTTYYKVSLDNDTVSDFRSNNLYLDGETFGGKRLYDPKRSTAVEFIKGL